ncbi:hypothetical protein PENDEC_c025G00722 [Penicillium decumbens]|uniref:Peptidase A1 domain-containing protein n=1 Tax=Penicillium decumbens TaxID=69771 RepID=A0A1V6NZT8_PENDC|nr:hypothetical protein PENDEC_c025G00722 [Penicillium decumbens]
MKSPYLCLVATLWSLCIKDVLAMDPWEMTWSSEAFGPDGPWHAVSVSIGGNNAKIALYPGAAWTSEILLSTICDNTTISPHCYGDQAGLFDPDQSYSYDNTSLDLPPNGFWSNIAYGYTNAVPIYAKAHRALDSVDIGGAVAQSVNLISISQGYQTYPGGKNYPLQVGVLSLGCPVINQSFSSYTYPINGTFITSSLYEQGIIPSYSYGMHIGSPSLGIPGSLRLGGYDSNRALGQVSSQPVDSGAFPIEMIDISIGVATGGSPWNSSNMTGLLAHDNPTLKSGLKMMVDPTNPYIYLPQSSCDAIAAKLPVTYNSDLGLYFWDTTSSQYTKIVTSPSYLAFTFSKNGVNTEEITIKVPFALLNLTLEAPLVTTPTQYFPCMGTDSNPVLGRAFLQAAFVGVNWSKGDWFLAQAPGPDSSFIENIIIINPSTTSITGSENSWEGTWDSFWTVLSSANSSVNSSTSFPQSSSSGTPSAGLSTGAKAGVGAGAGVGALVIIAAAFWFFLHRRTPDSASNQDSAATQIPVRRAVQRGPVDILDTKRDSIYELDHDRGLAFAPTSQTSGYGNSYGYSPMNKQNVQYSSRQPQSFQQGPYELPSRLSRV